MIEVSQCSLPPFLSLKREKESRTELGSAKDMIDIWHSFSCLKFFPFYTYKLCRAHNLLPRPVHSLHINLEYMIRIPFIYVIVLSDVLCFKMLEFNF